MDCGSAEPVANAAHLQSIARTLYQWRRLRDVEVGRTTRLFGEPAWDLLLDLYSRGGGRHTSVLGACIGAASPISTGLRRIRQLEAQGLVYREPDPNDARRCWLCLSDAGHRMTKVLGTLKLGELGSAER